MSQQHSSKHGEIGHYPISSPLKPLTSLSSGRNVNTAPVLSSTHDVPHPLKDEPSNPSDKDQSSASTQHSVAESTLSKMLVSTIGRTVDLSTQSESKQTVINNKPLDGDYQSHSTSEHYVQSTPTVSKTTGGEPETQREEEVKTTKDQACGPAEDFDQELPVTTLLYKGIMLPTGLFEPVDWHGNNIPPSPKLMDLSSMDNNDLTYYLQTLRTICNCDEFMPGVPCPLHGRGQHSLKRWTNDLLDAHSLYRTGNLCSQSHKLYISTDFTSTPSEGSVTANLEQHFSYEEEVSAIHPHNVQPTSTGKLKQMMRERLQAFTERGQDSGLVHKSNHAPPPTPQTEEAGGSATKAKTLDSSRTSQTTRGNTHDRSARSLKDKLKKLRDSNPNPEGFKSTPVFKKPLSRFHNTYMDRHGNKGSNREHTKTPDNPLQTSQTSQHGSHRVEKIVKAKGKLAVKDAQHPKQRVEYHDRSQGNRQMNVQQTHQLHKAAENNTSRQQAAIA